MHKEEHNDAQGCVEELPAVINKGKSLSYILANDSFIFFNYFNPSYVNIYLGLVATFPTINIITPWINSVDAIFIFGIGEFITNYK